MLHARAGVKTFSPCFSSQEICCLAEEALPNAPHSLPGHPPSPQGSHSQEPTPRPPLQIGELKTCLVLQVGDSALKVLHCLESCRRQRWRISAELRCLCWWPGLWTCRPTPALSPLGSLPSPLGPPATLPFWPPTHTSAPTAGLQRNFICTSSLRRGEKSWWQEWLQQTPEALVREAETVSSGHILLPNALSQRLFVSWSWMTQWGLLKMLLKHLKGLNICYKK